MSKTDKKKVILFICSGNTCRSPMLATITQSILGDNYICKSAGTTILSSHTEQNGKNAVDKILGIDSDYPQKTTAVSQQLIEEADVVFCLGENIAKNVLDRFNKVKEKLISDNIPDPYDLQYFPEETITQLMRSKCMDFEELRRARCQEAYDAVGEIMKDYAESCFEEKVDSILEKKNPDSSFPPSSTQILQQRQSTQHESKL